MLKINLSLKNSTPKYIKYFLIILLKGTNSFGRLDHNLHEIYEAIHVLNYFKGTLSGLRQFLATGNLFKIMKNAF